MDDLQELIRSLNVNESNEFKNFIARQSGKEKRKDIYLFNKMRQKNFNADKLFNLKLKNEKEQYHALRKRLHYSLTEYIALKYKQTDLSGTGSLLNTINVCRYLFENNINRLAWKYLIKAEEKARNEENYIVLNALYLLMLDYAHTPFALTLDEIIFRKKAAKKLADEDELITQYLAQARHKLTLVKITADTKDFTKYIEEIQSIPFISKRPAVIYTLTEIVRSAYLAQRMLSNFEHYIEEQYEYFNRITANQIKWHKYKLRMLYMLCHIYYRNRKFNLCLNALNTLKEEVTTHNTREKNKYNTLYISMLGSVYSLTGKNELAVKTHEEFILNNPKHAGEDNLNLQLNLAFFYFNSSQYKKANALLVQMHHSDNWYEKKMGKEWLIRKKLIACIMHYELGHDDIAIKELDSINKKYIKLFELPQYSKAKQFIYMLMKYINNPQIISKKDFEKISVGRIFLASAEQEDPKSIAFYCWLKAKIKQVDYYSLLLKEIRRKENE